jgi:hypothetical protein
VYGIHRSAVHAERLEAMGIIPVAQHDAQQIGTVAARATSSTMPPAGRLRKRSSA